MINNMRNTGSGALIIGVAFGSVLVRDMGASWESSLSSVVPAGLCRAVKTNGRSKVCQGALEFKEEGEKGNKKSQTNSPKQTKNPTQPKSQTTSGFL